MSRLRLKTKTSLDVVEDYKRIKEKLQATPLKFIELHKKHAPDGSEDKDRVILIQISHIEYIEP